MTRQFFEFTLQKGELLHVGMPAVVEERAARDSLPLETAFFRDTFGCRVARQNRQLQTVEAQRREQILDEHGQRFRNVTPAAAVCNVQDVADLATVVVAVLLRPDRAEDAVFAVADEETVLLLRPETILCEALFESRFRIQRTRKIFAAPVDVADQRVQRVQVFFPNRAQDDLRTFEHEISLSAVQAFQPIPQLTCETRQLFHFGLTQTTPRREEIFIGQGFGFLVDAP